MWGFSFKPDTDDVREAPSLVTIRALLDAGATIRAYDPEAMDNIRKLFGDDDRLVLVEEEFQALEGADALLVTTEWMQFSAVSLQRVKEKLKAPIIFDGRNIFTLDDMREAGFYYESIGRPIVRP